jgi:chromosomal replication initiation ATPase DnaA
MKPLWPAHYRPPRRALVHIIDDVCEREKISRDDLLGPRKLRHLCRARAAIAVELRSYGLSYPTIGRVLGGRDHTTIMNLVRRHTQYMREIEA